jgi:hypothetical protein
MLLKHPTWWSLETLAWPVLSLQAEFNCCNARGGERLGSRLRRLVFFGLAALLSMEPGGSVSTLAIPAGTVSLPWHLLVEAKQIGAHLSLSTHGSGERSTRRFSRLGRASVP